MEIGMKEKIDCDFHTSGEDKFTTGMHGCLSEFNMFVKSKLIRPFSGFNALVKGQKAPTKCA